MNSERGLGAISLRFRRLDSRDNRLELDSAAEAMVPRSRYPMSAILISQLGVDLRYQATGVGKATLHHAFSRLTIMSNEIGFEAVVVDAGYPSDDR